MPPKTAQQKQQASHHHKAHWSRCDVWGAALGAPRAAIHAHWKCCFSEEPWQGFEALPSAAEIETKKEKFLPCWEVSKQKWCEQQQELQREETARRVRHRPQPRFKRCSECGNSAKPETMQQRVQVMLWAVNRIDDIELAKDAFARVLRALEETDGD